MAVSFKVPKSPNKDIFDIDTFLGVDLTNSGADMDERRSPNAENMVRYVPGKVRKRTGYRKEVLFSSVTNVNYALGTSAEDNVNVVEDRSLSPLETTNYPLYNLSEKFSNTTVYIEFDYKIIRHSDYYSAVDSVGYYDSSNRWHSIKALDNNREWTHVSREIDIPYFYDAVSIVVQANNVTQDIYIGNFSFMKEKDENYKYSVAPKIFIERETTDPIYGCHVGKHGTFEGNRIVNVNRALNTSDTARSVYVSSLEQTLYTLGEYANSGTNLYVEFDIQSDTDDSNISINVEGYTYSFTASTEETHISFESVVPASRNAKTVVIYGSNCTVQINKFSVMYEKDDNYSWSAAPEDKGDKFHIEDMYYVGYKNYALYDSITSVEEAGTNPKMASFNIVLQPIIDELEGHTYVSFDISTSSEKECSSIIVRMTGGEGEYVVNDEYTTHLNKKHYEIYFIENNEYLSQLIVYMSLPERGKGTVQLTNIKVKTLTKREYYDVSSLWYLYHVGNSFYVRARNSKNFELMLSDANKHISRAWQLNKNIYIIDGKDIYVWEVGAGMVYRIDKEIAYIPTITIAKEPSGGGTSYDPINLLQPGFCELFQGASGTTEYQLTFGSLDDDEVKAYILDGNGSWVEKYENTHFTVNRSLGKITFTTAPGVSPITGEDNIKIIAYRTIEDYKERITKCTHGILYGIGGAGDRLFLAGNPDHQNWDFYSQQFDPTYFPDTNYATLGSEQSMITGYAIVNNYLATFKDGFDQSQSVFVREGDLLKTNSNTEKEESDTTEPVFKLINTLQGEGVVAPYTFGYIQTEPLFLTKQGIYAITEQDITGEKYTQSRSFYLNGQLRKELNPENAMACVYDDQYILALNNHLYILDGLQATRTDKSEPYATRQYAGFYCTNVPALCIWQDEGVWFGTNDGKVCAFNTDIESLNSYNDEGNPIYACWETPDLDGRLFYKNKTFRYFAVRLMQAIKTSAKLYSRKLGVWNFIREESVIGNPIDFENFDFDMFSFSQDTTEKVIHTKVRVKKVDKARFRVENGEYNEPFGLFDLALEFIESGNYKG